MNPPVADLTLVAASSLPVDAVADCFQASFADYVVPLRIARPALLDRMRTDGVDFAASRIVMRPDGPAGLALMARRGSKSRMAAMALVPALRRRGVGAWLLQAVLAEAQARREREVLLEVIEQNVGALTLYEQNGFVIVDRLVGFSRSPGPALPGSDVTALTEVSIGSVAGRITAWSPETLPWQLSGQSMAMHVPPARGYRLGPAWAVISDPATDPVRIHSLVVDPGARRHGWARRLVATLIALRPERTWEIPVLAPESIGLHLYPPLGFVSEPMTQLLMRCAL